MRLEHSLLAQVGEELASCDVLHYEVNQFGVLVDALEVDLGYKKEVVR